MKRKSARKSNSTIIPVLDKLMVRALRERQREIAETVGVKKATSDFVSDVIRGKHKKYMVNPRKRTSQVKSYDDEQVRTLLQRANEAVRHNLQIIEHQQDTINKLLFMLPQAQLVSLAMDGLLREKLDGKG